MELRRMPRRLACAAVFIATGAAGLAAVPMASAASIPLRVGPAGITHIGLHGVDSSSAVGATLPAGTVTSTNWSGYAQNGASGTYKSVVTSWVQPAVNCSQTPNSYAAFWDGLDGYSSSTVEQDGTLAECVSSGRGRKTTQVAEYTAWYETYPNPMYQFGGTVAPGDYMTATVTSNTTKSFTLTLADNPAATGAHGWTASTTQTLSSAAALSSAEVIAEAPSSGSGVLPLADFGTVNFAASTVNGTTMTTGTPIEMVSSRNQPEAIPGSLSSRAFSDTWQ